MLIIAYDAIMPWHAIHPSIGSPTHQSKDTSTPSRQGPLSIKPVPPSLNPDVASAESASKQPLDEAHVSSSLRKEASPADLSCPCPRPRLNYRWADGVFIRG